MRTDLDQNTFAASAGAAARLLRAMANEHRLMILCRLADGERSVSELLQQVALSQSALSQHLAQLRQEGLVATRRQSQMIFYRLDSPDVVAVIQTLAERFCPGGAALAPAGAEPARR